MAVWGIEPWSMVKNSVILTNASIPLGPIEKIHWSNLLCYFYVYITRLMVQWPWIELAIYLMNCTNHVNELMVLIDLMYIYRHQIYEKKTIMIIGFSACCVHVCNLHLVSEQWRNEVLVHLRALFHMSAWRTK